MIERQPVPSLRATIGPERRSGLQVLIIQMRLEEEIAVSKLGSGGISMEEAEYMVGYGRVRLASQQLMEWLDQGEAVRVDCLYEDSQTTPWGFVMEGAGAFVDNHPQAVEVMIRAIYSRDLKAQKDTLSKDGQRLLNTLRERRGIIFETGKSSDVRIFREKTS